MIKVKNLCWFMAKPKPYYHSKFFTQIWHALLVLSNKAVAVQYAEDFFKK